MTIFHVLQIKDQKSNNILNATGSIKDVLIPIAEEDDQQLYGVFTGIFGLATNELYWVMVGKDHSRNLTKNAKELGLHVPLSLDMIPTARPLNNDLLFEPGIYVFRWFEAYTKDVEEIVSLSSRAWVSFEDDFDSRIHCLLAELEPSGSVSKMLLLTWYKNLTVWQDSRAPSDEAMKLFIKRHDLTLEALPIATRLLT